MKKLLLSLFIIASIAKQTQAQIITTVAGNGYGAGGTGGYSGDGGQATNAELNWPDGLSLDGMGNLYIVDNYNKRVRIVNTNGIISTIAGDGGVTNSGDGGPATAAGIYNPRAIAIDNFGNVCVSEAAGNVVRKINTNNIISTIVGNGTHGYSGDGGQATNAELNYSLGLTLDAVGNIYVADAGNGYIRMVNTNGIISTIAGNGTSAWSGDGGLATNAGIGTPMGLTFDAAGNLYISDNYNNRVRIVYYSETAGGLIINTIAGGGSSLNDGGAATNDNIWPGFMATDGIGNLYIADEQNARIRKVNTNGVISTIAGNSTSAWSGDGGLATNAGIGVPEGLAFDAAGNLYISDHYNHVVRKITNVAQQAGIEQFATNKEQLTIYPNPSTGSIQVSYTNSMDELKVSNMLGQVVYEAKPSSTSTNVQIDNAGVYFITITSGASISTQKVIVQ